MSRPKLWTKDFIIVSTANFFLYFTFYLLMATVTLFATDRFHASPSVAGLASGIFVVGVLVARLFAGKSIDRIGRKKMLYAGFIAILIISLFYFVTNQLGVLLAVRFLNGAALGIASTATGTIVAGIIPNERRGEGTGYYALSVTLAAAVGPFVGMFLIQHASFNMVFALCLVLLALSFISALFLKVPKVELSKADLEKMKGLKISNFFESKVFPIAIISAFVGLGYSSILSFLTSYAKEMNLVDISSFFFIVYAVTVLVSRPFTGRWFDTKGENFVMYPSFLLFAAGLVLLNQADSGLLILLAGIFVGLGYGTFSASGQAIAVKVSPKNRIGLATSTFFIFLDAGVGVGPFLLGLLVPFAGYHGLYAIMAVVLVFCVFLYYFVHGKKAASLQGVVEEAE
ncbi:MFS transporter [Weizmannia coagulans]|uniref:Major facilitator superfamily MFS_1 n=3 Tax=Heyndrickxia TaxID=2837504 RepID=G2TH93_HEYCO|nr:MULTISPECIES: MFS transporter [Heyndrickxia]AEO99992.1 major facilitator superfamily MFS_1 [Heyndrickxia coagulans 36D1]AJO24327.1 major facilitator superfamily protein [Heyndrickxia coagulans]AKN54205.1 Major facilitator family transporter [Heyndrickxia coagulans]ATW84187.1 MFS transporter [Heyndrickxia coagulans]KGB30473.1 multidrug MFS transporter [Heyndrickxia coagulans]